MGGAEILVVGGYGIVGRRIAAQLSLDYPDRVVIAGRNLVRAEEVAAAMGNGVRGRNIDITVPASIASALNGAAVVIGCIDQPGRKLMWAAMERGLRYTDIAPHLTELGRGDAYNKIIFAARASGAIVVLGTGLVPGISNMIVRALADRLGGADEIETALLLSAHDTTGPASFDYFLQELSIPFDIHIDGRDRPVHPFSAPHIVEFPPPIGARLSYLFPFSDQVLYPRTMGVKTAVTRLALEPSWLARLLALSVRTGVSHVVTTEVIRNALVRRRQNRTTHKKARFALRVDVKCNANLKSATFVGPSQANAAAAGAAEIARLLIEGNIAEPGAWMPEQIAAPQPFLSRLACQEMNVKFLDGVAESNFLHESFSRGRFRI